jgi:hypothetical protein
VVVASYGTGIIRTSALFGSREAPSRPPKEVDVAARVVKDSSPYLCSVLMRSEYVSPESVLQTITFFLDDMGRPSDVFWEFHASIQKLYFTFLHAEQIVYIGDGMVRVKFFAGENVQTKVILIGKGVDANMTFRDENKA